MLEKFIDNDVMGFERVLRDIEKILLLITENILVVYIILLTILYGVIKFLLTCTYFRSLCVKDQLNEYLPALFQIIHGIEATGLLDVIRKSPEVWNPVFESGNYFKISPDEFLDQLVPHYS